MENTMSPSVADLPPVLRVKQLTFGYAHRQLFNNLSLSFGPGFTWIQGGNGSGKSTFLQLVAGALRPLAGRIDVQGVPQDTDPLAYRRWVFWCGPGALPFDHLSALEYFGFIQGLYPSFDLDALASHVAGFGLESHQSKLMRSLSTGTQRKVWLAAALSMRTPVVLLDEPLNALDQASLRHLEASLAARAQPQAANPQAWLVASHEPFGRAADHAVHVDIESPHPVLGKGQ